jgi:archaemetzincin
LSGSITIRPLGFVEEDVLHRISDSILRTCGLACRITPGMETPDYAYNETRGQYDSKVILKALHRHLGDSLSLIAVTHVDLYVPILKFVFGLAHIEGACSVISLYRLQPQFYDAPPDRQVFLGRAEKTAIHELGHGFGLTHCRSRRCVMSSSTRIQDTDQKHFDFCHTCSELLRWRLDKRLGAQRS